MPSKRPASAAVRRPYKERRLSRYAQKSLAMPTISIKRLFYRETWTFSTTSVGDFWRYYQPTVNPAFNNFPEFAAVFDQYKVNGVKITFRPRMDQVDGSSTTLTGPMPNLVTVIDPYSTLTPAGTYGAGTLNLLLEQSNAKVHKGDEVVDVYWKPKIQIPTNVGSGVTYVDSSKMWLNCTSDLVPMRGFHVMIQNNAFSTTAPNVIYDVYFTWYITFRNLK